MPGRAGSAGESLRGQNVANLFDEGPDLAHASAWLSERRLIAAPHRRIHGMSRHNQLMDASTVPQFVGPARDRTKP